MGDRNDNQDDGRWTPVINNHTRHGGISRNQPLVTLFVDNLPDNTSQPWLKMMFNNYGVVKEVFIPQKRSKATGNKFGFIRYDCPVSADLAVLKANGLWLDDKKLFVKIASFGAKGGLKQAKIDKADADTRQGGVNKSGSHNEVLVNNGRSFAQVLIGKKAPIGIDNLPKDAMKTINLQPVGNGWLFRSAIATLRRVISMVDLKQQLLLAKINFSDVRSLGGRFVLITFSNQQLRDDLIKGAWWDQWFDLIQPWNGEASGLERFAWISCRGIPLNVWGVSTFKKIGELWGTFLSVDDDTLKYLAFDKARILISTTSPHKIVDSIQLIVNQVQYLAHISEEEHPTFSLPNVGDNGSIVGGFDNWEARKDDVEIQAPLENIVVAVGKDRPFEMAALKEVVENVESNVLPLPDVGFVRNHITEEVTNALAMESAGGINDNNSYSPHGLDSLVGLESLVVKSIAQPFQGRLDAEVMSNFHMLAEDTVVEEKSPGIDCSVVEETMEEVAVSMKNVADPLEVSVDGDDCTTVDLASDEPLFKYVDLKRQRKKNRTKQGVRRNPIWTKNPLKAAIFSRTLSRDHKEEKLKTFKLGLKIGTNSKAPCSLSKNGSLSLGDSRHSDFEPNLLSQEGDNRMRNKVEKEFSVSLARAKTLDVNLLPGDEALLKELLEEDFH